MKDVQTHERERDDYSDGKKRKIEKTEREKEKERRRNMGEKEK